MPLYIALLRAVNVGGHAPVVMSDLRDLLARMGFHDGRSLLQTGNLVFRSDGRKSAPLEAALETEAAARLDIRTDFFVRSATEWATLMDRNPFPAEAKRDPGRLIVMCLKAPAADEDVESLRAAISGRELVRTDGRHAYIVYPDGMGRSRLTGTLIERKLRTRGTARNWNTVSKLRALSES